MNLGIARSMLIYYGQPWRRARMERLYRRFVAPGDLCFDVGAHVGNRVRCFRAIGARVIAVEPQPDCVAVLRRLYGGDEQVRIEPVGLAEGDGTLTLRTSARNPTVSSFSQDWIDEVSRDPSFAGVRWDGAVEVEVTTLDALIQRFGFPAFVKIDVEGLERQVLEGLSVAVASLSFEVVPAARERGLACVDRLEALGEYRYLWSPGESHQLQWERPVDATQIRAFILDLAQGRPSGDVYAVRSDVRYPR